MSRMWVSRYIRLQYVGFVLQSFHAREMILPWIDLPFYRSSRYWLVAFISVQLIYGRHRCSQRLWLMAILWKKKSQKTKTYLWTCVNSEDSDQSDPFNRLVRISTGRILDSHKRKVSPCGHQRHGCADWSESSLGAHGRRCFFFFFFFFLTMSSNKVHCKPVGTQRWNNVDLTLNQHWVDAAATLWRLINIKHWIKIESMLLQRCYMLNKIRCHAHFLLSANLITWPRLLIQIHIRNDSQYRPWSTLFAKAGYIRAQQDQV